MNKHSANHWISVLVCRKERLATIRSGTRDLFNQRVWDPILERLLIGVWNRTHNAQRA